LFTHPAAAVAFKVGDATDTAIVVAGAAAVTVAPMLMFVGLTDIAGTVGDEYAPVTDESPDPPATLVGAETPECRRLTVIAATMALAPTKPANDFTRLTPICFVLLGQPATPATVAPSGDGATCTTKFVVVLSIPYYRRDADGSIVPNVVYADTKPTTSKMLTAEQRSTSVQATPY
jgi:hypothetical protein